MSGASTEDILRQLPQQSSCWEHKGPYGGTSCWKRNSSSHPGLLDICRHCQPPRSGWAESKMEPWCPGWFGLGGWPWQVAEFQHPSARAAGQVASCPGVIQLAQDQLWQPSSHPPPGSSGPDSPQAMGWHISSYVIGLGPQWSVCI